ncbi:MAG: sigma 54-interacting transcriptional regulator [Terriglobales bacterium]|jgi:formate hydrogenlyase transcriptional activator
MGSNSTVDNNGELRRYEALLQTADLVVHHQELPDLFRELALCLRELADFELASFSLHDSLKNVMRVHTWEGSTLTTTPDEVAIEDSTSGWVWRNQQPLVVPDERLDKHFPESVTYLREKGIRSYCTLPLTTAQRRLGALGLGSTREEVYDEKNLRLLRRIAELVALAVENALMYGALELEKDRLQTLLEVNATLITSLDLQELFPAISGFIRKVIRQEYASIALHDEATNSLRIRALDFPLAKGLIGAEIMLSLDDSVPCARAFRGNEIKVFTQGDLVGMHSTFANGILEQGIRTLCCIPLITRNGTLGTLNLASREDNAFMLQDLNFLKQVAAQVAIALDNARAYREIAQLTKKLATEKLYLEDEIRLERNFEEIVGDSPALKRVLGQAKTVAPSDATVLILGDTGTGKELVARAVHRMSSRKDASFIKLNCAAIPTGLLESELFGHEKGAFTGAVTQKVGRIELADKGTLFLDEVGEIPLELQPKLLRVLQDQEFERLGGTRTIKVSIRLVAATNRDLEKAVAERDFRSDLFYRLNVFPIRMPRLRDRGKDIPLLVRYFVQKFARRMNKQIETIPTETMHALSGWEWPGNVRELENFIERSVILSDGPVLNVPLTELRPSNYDPSRLNGTLESLERDHIVRVLRETDGVIAGSHGAAMRLGMKRTTLQSRMQKLGIQRVEYED